MDLGLTPDQREVVATFERVFARESPIERVRAAEGVGFDPALWKVLAELGSVGIAVPGDAGGGLVELVLVAEAAGRRLACAPIVEAAVAACALAESGAPADVLDATLAGDRTVVLAPRSAERGGGAALTPAGAVADAVLALDGDELVLVHSPAGERVGELGFLAVADRPLRGPDADRRVLAAGARAREIWNRALGRWRIGAAAQCAGLAAEALDLAVRYAVGRVQFGVPIGSFQAIQQQLADVVMACDAARLLAREAAWRHDHGLPSWPGAAATAFAHASETAVRAGEVCLHVHGGYGYTLEYDAQLYLRRAKAISLVAGDPDLLWEEIGAAAVAGEG